MSDYTVQTNSIIQAASQSNHVIAGGNVSIWQKIWQYLKAWQSNKND